MTRQDYIMKSWFDSNNKNHDHSNKYYSKLKNNCGGDLCHTYFTDTVGQDPCQDWTLLERVVRKCIPENALACLSILTTQVFSASTDEKMHLITWVAIWDPFALSSQLALHHTRQESREGSLLVSPALPKAPLQPWNTLFPSTLPSFPTVSPCPCHTEEAEACQALPTPPKVKGEHLFEVICFDCEQESHLAAIPASNPWACWVNLALFSGWASVSSLVPSTSPRANPQDHTCRSDHSRDWMGEGWTTQQGPGWCHQELYKPFGPAQVSGLKAKGQTSPTSLSMYTAPREGMWL